MGSLAVHEEKGIVRVKKELDTYIAIDDPATGEDVKARNNYGVRCKNKLYEPNATAIIKRCYCGDNGAGSQGCKRCY